MATRIEVNVAGRDACPACCTASIAPTTSFCDPSPRFLRAQFVEDFSEEHLNASRWIVTAYTENSGGQCGFGVGRYGKCLPEKCLDGRAGRLAISQQRQLVHRGGRCFNYTSGSVITHSKGGLERQGQCRLPAVRASRAAWSVGARRESCHLTGPLAHAGHDQGRPYEGQHM